MNWLDKAIDYVAPSWGLARSRARMAINAVRNYDAAIGDRNSNWMPTNQTPEETDAAYRDRVRARARDLERNSDIAQAAVRAIKRNVIGTGIRPQADTGDPDLNNKIEAVWKWWTRPENCDITGGSSFYELQQMLVHRRFFDGEILVKPVVDKRKAFPLSLQFIEADYLDSMKTEGNNNRPVLGGVEIDKTYRPQAYWLLENIDSLFLHSGRNESKRVPADKILHYYNKTRPTALRGMSELAVVMERLKDTGETITAEVVATKVAACFAGFVEDEMPATAVGRLPQNSAGQRIDGIEPGMLHYLGKGQKVSFATPGRPNTSVGDFLQMMLRYTGSGLGLSYEALSRDVSKANYSSIRQGNLDDRQEWRMAQQSAITHFCEPIWELFMDAAVLSGKVKIRGYWENRGKYTTCFWTAPGWSWIDPLKEVKASREELAAGMTTLAKVCAAKGEDWQEVLEQMAHEKAYAEKLGLNLIWEEGKEAAFGDEEGEGGTGKPETG